MQLRIVHLLSQPDSEREQRSIREVSALSENTFGYQYVQVINEPYDGPIPPARDDNGTRPFKLGQGAYGCYKAHRDAMLAYLTPDISALLLCEGDCAFTLPMNQVIARIWRAYNACLEHDLIAFTLGPKHGGETIEDFGNGIVTTTRLIETHAVLVPIASRGFVEEMLSKPWDTIDYVWTIYGYDQAKKRIGIFEDKIVAVQMNATSLVDGKYKDSEEHFRHLEGQN